MRFDEALVGALAAKCQYHCDQMAVHRVRHRNLDELERAATEMAARFGEMAHLGKLRCESRRYVDHSIINLQEGITAKVFHASGVVLLDRGWSPMSHILSANAEDLDAMNLRRMATEKAVEAVHRMHLAGAARPDELRFERLWKMKATGVTGDGKRGAVAVTRVVAAFRRFLGAVPVWGRASITVELAGEGQTSAASVDWREIADEPIAYTRVLSPEDGAARVLGELHTYWPGGCYTLNEYTPELFAFGYFSMPKRRHQRVMQPVFVAMLKPTGPIPSMGRLVVVPAAATAYEPICRTVVAPPIEGAKLQLTESAPHRSK